MHKCILNGLVQSKNNYLGSYSVVHKGFISCDPPPPPPTHTHSAIALNAYLMGPILIPFVFLMT